MALVARLHAARDIRLGDEPEPVAADGESVVAVSAVGLCGSDLHWYTDGGIGDAVLSRPLVGGHEMAGVIHGGTRDGERVAVDPAISCGHCDLCLQGYRNLCRNIVFAGHSTCDGGLRELMAWPTRLLHRLPDSVADADGAMLEPLGVAIHALDLGHVRLGATAAVIGCGPIGLCLIQLLRLAGASSVLGADPLPHRRAAAERAGADIVLDPYSDAYAEQLHDATSGVGADVTFEVAGNDAAIAASVQVSRPGARVVLVGIPDDDRSSFPAGTTRRKGLTIVMARRMNDVYPRAIELASTGRIELGALVSDRYPLAEVNAAFEFAAARNGLKVVVEP
jgi:L-iditol 2-dehydrogenase